MEQTLGTFSTKTPLTVNTKQVLLALNSWDKVVQLIPTWHIIFYTEIFNRNPSVKQLFPRAFDDINHSNSYYTEHVQAVGGSIRKTLAGLLDRKSCVASQLKVRTMF